LQLQAAGHQPRLIHGAVHCDRVDCRLGPFLAAAGHRDAAHYWVVVGDHAYDITADQFNYRLDRGAFPSVLIVPVGALARHHACGETDPYVTDDDDWPAAFLRERARVARESV